MHVPKTEDHSAETAANYCLTQSGQNDLEVMHVLKKIRPIYMRHLCCIVTLQLPPMRTQYLLTQNNTHSCCDFHVLESECVCDVTALDTTKHCRKSDANEESGSTPGGVFACVPTP